MSWWTAVPVILACIGLVLVPGALLAYSLGFRRITLLGLAPAFSLAVVGVAAVAAPLVGIGWNIWAVVVLTAVASAGALLVTDFRQKGANRETIQRDSWQAFGAAVMGLGVGAFLIGRRIMQLVGAPDNISQRYDNVFQLNAVRYVLDSGNGSTLSLGKMAGGEGLGAVYPAVWHDLAALLVQLTGTSVLVAENAVNTTIGTIIWPISIIFLTRVVLGPKPVALIAAGIVSAGLVAFPFLLLVWGPLFPNMLSVSVVPAGLAVVIMLCKLGDQKERPLRLWLAFTVLIPGLALSHMSAVGGLLAFSAPIVAWAIGQHVIALVQVKAPWWRYAVVAASSFVGILAAYFVWRKLRPGDYSGWTPHTNMSGAIGEVATNAVMGVQVAWVISILAVIGIVTMLSKRTQIWWLLSYGVAAALYIADAALDKGFLRTFLTGIWYADTNRVAAYLPIFAVVLAALGFTRVIEGLLVGVQKAHGSRSAVVTSDTEVDEGAVSPHNRQNSSMQGWVKPVSAILVIVLLGLLVIGTQKGVIGNYIAASKQFYERNTASSILSDDEYKLLARIDQEVPADAVIIGNPWNGSTLVYAFANRKVLKFHLTDPTSPTEALVEKTLNMAREDPATCNAIRELNVRYVLDFGTQYLLNHPQSGSYAGLQNLATSDSVELIDQQGDAKLYRVTACW